METRSESMADARQKKFKSYYVVWKQKMKIIINNHSPSLNRTMQYGNTAIGLFGVVDPPV